MGKAETTCDTHPAVEDVIERDSLPPEKAKWLKWRADRRDLVPGARLPLDLHIECRLAGCDCDLLPNAVGTMIMWHHRYCHLFNGWWAAEVHRVLEERSHLRSAFPEEGDWRCTRCGYKAWWWDEPSLDEIEPYRLYCDPCAELVTLQWRKPQPPGRARRRRRGPYNPPPWRVHPELIPWPSRRSALSIRS